MRKNELIVENERLRYENRVLRAILSKKNKELKGIEKEANRLQERRAEIYMKKQLFTEWKRKNGGTADEV